MLATAVQHVNHWAASLSWLSPQLTSKSSSYVKNFTHFVKIIGKASIPSNEKVSQDVISLFMRLPTNETLTVTLDKLTADPSLDECTCMPRDNLMEMLTFCAGMTYIEVRSDICRQEEDMAMGSPLSPVLANIHGILRGNDIRIYITKATDVAKIRCWYIHFLAVSGRRSNITRLCELNLFTNYTVPYGERTDYPS